MTTAPHSPQYVVTHWLPGRAAEQPDGSVRREPATPCPDLLTLEEAGRYCRYDEVGGDWLRGFLRVIGHYVAPVKQGNRNFYRRVDLDAYLEARTREQ